MIRNNKKGFTLVEVIVSLAILGLLLSIAVISLDGILNTVDEDYYHTLENNLKLSANDYFEEHRERLPINSYNSVSIQELVDKNYIEPLKDKNGNVCTEGDVFVYPGSKTTYEYEVCLKCGNYTSSGTYCGNEIVSNNIVRIPTSSLCKGKAETTYTGYDIQLTKTMGEEGKYVLSGNIQKEANELGYRITATLISNDLMWSDNTKEDKYFSCNLYKRNPEITLSPLEGVVAVGKSKTFNEKADIKGKFTNSIEDATLATVTPQNSSTDVAANTSVSVTTNGIKEGSTKIIVEFEPADEYKNNYNSLTRGNGARVYNLSVVSGIEKPSSQAFCKSDLVYNGTAQILTIEPTEGYTFVNNVGINAGDYTVEARLNNGNSWNDGTNNQVSITCNIAKANPVITVSSDSVKVEENGSVTIEEASNVDGTFTNVIEDTSKASASPMIYNDVKKNVAKIVTITGKSKTNGNILLTINLTPTGDYAINYNEASKVVEVQVMKTGTWIKTGSTTSSSQCAPYPPCSITGSCTIGSTCSRSIIDPKWTYKVTCSWNGASANGGEYNSQSQAVTACYTKGDSFCLDGSGSFVCTYSRTNNGKYLCYNYTCS